MAGRSRGSSRKYSMNPVGLPILVAQLSLAWKLLPQRRDERREDDAEKTRRSSRLCGSLSAHISTTLRNPALFECGFAAAASLRLSAVSFGLASADAGGVAGVFLEGGHDGLLTAQA